MASLLILTIPLLVVAAFLGLIYLMLVGSMQHWERERRRAMEKADAQFQSARLAALDQKFSFDGSTVTVMAEKLGKLRRSFGDLHRICQNPEGEFFLYISGPSPDICHLTAERALPAIQLMKQDMLKSLRPPFAAILPESAKPPAQSRRAQ